MRKWVFGPKKVELLNRARIIVSFSELVDMVSKVITFDADFQNTNMC
jgi:hypothetical protein